MTSKVHYMSQRQDWETPQFLFDGSNAEFGFDMDVCATPESAKCRKFFASRDDGLTQHWQGICWMNPPYGREIARWMQKAFESAQDGATAVCLVPARTDTKSWHRFAMRGAIRPLRGRRKFGRSVNSAPFPGAVVIFRLPKSGQPPIVP